MPSTMRVTFFFRQHNYGFSDIQAIQGDSPIPSSYLTKANALAMKRALLLGTNSYLTHIRITTFGTKRVFFTFKYPGQGITTDTNETSDSAVLALLTKQWNANETRNRHIYPRGIWDSCCKEGGIWVPNPDWTARWHQYAKRLVQDKWGWLADAAPVVKPVQAAGVVQNANGTVGVTTVGDLIAGPFPRNASVRISGVQGATQVNGQMAVTFTAGNVFYTRRRIPIFPYTTGGQVTYAAEEFVQINSSQFDRVVEKKSGLVSYQSRGKKKASRVGV